MWRAKLKCGFGRRRTTDFDLSPLFDAPAKELDCRSIFNALYDEQYQFERNKSQDNEDNIDYRTSNWALMKILESKRVNHVNEINEVLLPYNKLQRREIVNSSEWGTPVIFTAVKKKYLTVIQYFLKECEVCVDVHTVCVDRRNIRGLGNDIEMTPLFCACIDGDMEVVKLLINNGAQVCWTNSSGQMPVHAAICQGHIEIVQYLMELMGDINVKYSSMFLASAPNEKMFHYLISKGFDPNRKDSMGFTSLHIALRFDKNSDSSHDTVKMLLQAGADLNIIDSDGFDAIIVAAKESDYTSFNMLSSQANANQISVINGYELLGALYILDGHFLFFWDSYEEVKDDDGGVSNQLIPLNDDPGPYMFWSTALSLRYADPSKPVEKPVEKQREIFEFATEFQTRDDLIALEDQHELVQCNQAALVLERILGCYNQLTLRNLSQNFAGNLLHYEHFRRSFNMLMYTRSAHLDRDEFSGMSITTMEAIIKVIYQAYYSAFIFQKEPIQLLSMILKQMKDFVKEIRVMQNEFCGFSDSDSSGKRKDVLIELSSETYEDKGEFESKSSGDVNKMNIGLHRESLIPVYQENAYRLSDCCLNLFYYLLAINSSKFNKEVEELFHQFVVLDIRGAKEESVLHIVSYLLSTSEISGQNLHKYNVRYSVVNDLFDYLILFKADVNSFDMNSNTPLHYALQPIKEKQTRKGLQLNTTVEKLIKHGAHVDYFDNDGDCSLDVLHDMDHNIDEINVTSLQCLAARAYMQYGGRLIAYLPPTLNHFCYLHSDRKLK